MKSGCINGSNPAAPAFGLLVIGDEILSGRWQDKHLPKLIELLAARAAAGSSARAETR